MTDALPPADPPVSLSMEQGVATIVLALAQPKNTFRTQDVQRLGERLEASLAAGARCVVLRARGKTFCAGWDVSSIRPGRDDPVAVIEEVVAPLLRRLRALPVPTISVVRGAALGFGFGLALACDLCVAEESALFGSPFRALGMVPDSGTHWLLQTRLGSARAAELIYTGRLMTGSEAVRLGLINHAAGSDALDEIAADLASDIAGGPTVALRLSKEILLANGDFDAVLTHEARALRAVFATEDLREGIAAFQERRRPEFHGR